MGFVYCGDHLWMCNGTKPHFIEALASADLEKTSCKLCAKQKKKDTSERQTT